MPLIKMWETSPWAHLQHLEQQKERAKKFTVIMALLAVVLMLDYSYVGPSDDSVFSQSFLGTITMICIALATYAIYEYLQMDVQVKKLRNSDVISEQKRMNIEKSKELLRKAGVNSGQKVIRNPMNMHENFRPAYQSFEPYSPPQPVLRLNIKPFDSIDDGAEEFLRSKGIDKSMKLWTQNVKMWFSKEFLPLIIENYSTNLTRLNAYLREHTQTKERPWIYSGTFEDESLTVSYEESMYFKRATLKEVQDLAIEIGCNYAKDLELTRSFSFRGQNPVENQKALQRVNFIDTLKQRMIFEKYIDVPGYSCRGYVIQRIKALARSPCLSGYSASSGGFYKSDGWTPKRPTDAHILAHIFFCLLNNGNNPTFNPDANIMNEIVVNFPNPAPRDERPEKARFYQKNTESQIEPHYDVISGSEIWQACKGNDNLFSAIALFLYHIKTKAKGYFIHMNCAELMELIA